LNKVINFFVLNNLFVAICVAALTLSSQLIYSEFNLELVFFSFFATFLSYNFHSLFSNKTIKDFNLNKIFDHFSLLIILLLLLSFVFGFILFIQFNPLTKFYILVLSLVSLFYPFGLRTIPFLKIFLISTSWTISSVCLFFSENQVQLDESAFLMLLKRFLFIMAITIPFDLRDYKFDDLKMKTFPQIFGYNFSKKIAIGFLIIYLCISTFEFLSGDLKLSFFVSFILTFLYSSFLIIKTSEKKNKLFFLFFVESASISILFFLIITSIFL